MRIVAALGGNALLRRGEPPDVEVQRHNVKQAVHALVPLAHGNDLVVTHGNGPQVGLLALQAAAYREVAPYPLDVLGAESEGMIGYLLEQELASLLGDRPVATLLTQVVVDPRDPAFSRPTKPIGPLYDRDAAAVLSASRGWFMGPDTGGFRRLVPSPEPLRILELAAIAILVESGVVVVCAGGGGVPVVIDEAGGVRGVEAVVDKDLSATLLARELAADVLLLLTDVEGVWWGWGGPAPRLVAEADPAGLRALGLPAGSMGPKAEAAARFVEATGRVAVIGPLQAAARMVAGEAGTVVHRGAAGIRFREGADAERG
jgi:carbamate kinase